MDQAPADDAAKMAPTLPARSAVPSELPVWRRKTAEELKKDQKR
jgi:hypothetical protein